VDENDWEEFIATGKLKCHTINTIEKEIWEQTLENPIPYDQSLVATDD
jgi:hypothetical protein